MREDGKDLRASFKRSFRMATDPTLAVTAFDSTASDRIRDDDDDTGGENSEG